MEYHEDIKQVLRYIEENMRVTDQTSIEYLDSQGNIDRLSLKQNHIIFGRRGSGKSLLLKSLKENKNVACISVNLENFKDISFPDSIIQVQKSIIKQLIPVVNNRYGILSLYYWRKSKPIIRKLRKQIQNFDLQLSHPDEYSESIRKKIARNIFAGGKGGVAGVSIKSGAEEADEIETSKELKVEKLNILKNQLMDIKELFTDASRLIAKDLYLILDDFYFIRKDDQPYFLDFFHRLSKDTPLYLKVATIKHRSKLYIQGDSYIGIEIPHDAQGLNLDYSLQDFDSLVKFMKSLLNHINKKTGVSIDYEALITEQAFRYLCLASGGVPRDFFSLLISLGPLLGGKTISKPNVIEKSIENVAYKMEAFKKDAAGEVGVLEHYLKYIRSSIINDKKWNAFLVSNLDVQSYSQINQAIKELVDMRFLHLVNPNTSASSSDGMPLGSDST